MQCFQLCAVITYTYTLTHSDVCNVKKELQHYDLQSLSHFEDKKIQHFQTLRMLPGYGLDINWYDIKQCRAITAEASSNKVYTAHQ